MRAFFCFFFVLFCGLCAQENPEIPTFEKFKTDYDLIKKEIDDAKSQTTTVDFNWVEGHTQYLMKMVGTREFLLRSEFEVVRESARNIDLQPLIDDILFVGKRLVVNRNVQVWELDDISPKLQLLSQELNRFDQSGLLGPYELYRPSKIFWDLEIIGQVLAHSEFVSRVCKGTDGCVDRIAVLQKKVITDQTRAELWKKKVEGAKPTGSK